MPTRTTDLFSLEDLAGNDTAGDLAPRDREALRAVADWIKEFVLEPNDEIGRPGPVCPFMPTSVERQRTWLAPAHIGDGSAAHVVELMNRYKRRLLGLAPPDGEDIDHDVITVVFTDLPADRAQGIFDDVLRDIAVPSYVADGIVFGPFYDGNRATALYNDGFCPFQSPIPFIFVRHGVVGDWKFFVDEEDWLTLWARRFGEQGVRALAAELRRLPWNARRD
ncbi:DUF6875 domain-containing protein [Modestobacter marinus]|uniref:DUF6875 domain-containing protein n=1 Tax=Modestobacter marinus TaxID=477641 RepID=UPI001C9826B0|nr:hypothetical protein [Modestobacter marinus]